MSICPSVHMEQLGSHWKDFHEIWYLSIFQKTVEKIQVSLKSDKNKGYFTWRILVEFKKNTFKVDVFDRILLISS